ncbi:Mur ligase family, catalytic domain protein [Corynebacterium accolens ATCC 49726]|nr:Mur ligase family, catalytic domain protein [Corynebacterium accolens ATCC 49726]
MSVSLEKLAQLSHGRVIGDGTVEVSACGLDSASLPEGALFAALPGTRVHGAQFVGDTKAGAVLTDAPGLDHLRQANETRPIIVVDDIRAVLGPIAAEIYGHPTRDLTVLGIPAPPVRPRLATCWKLASCRLATPSALLAPPAPASIARRCPPP